ncbi:MAG: phytanoyl-CoA dioxygenase family protein [Caldilineaceae bacterium]|nr:phytanoyl-CoA dioxygenase family protein [Caldilineaceae bacterium]
MTQPTITLTQEQIDFFRREGYLTLPAITTAAEVIQLQAIYDRLFATKAGRAEGDHLDLVTTDGEDEAPVLPQILNPSKYAPELVDTVFRANALAIAKQLLGETATGGSDHAILKPPHTEAATPWHQDEAYWSADREYDALSIWIPLQEATLENGCMQFVPGTHQQEVLPHHPIGNDPRVIGLEVDNVEALATNAVACPLPAGGATIHHSRTLHFTGPNHTDAPRRAYILGFGVPAKQRPISRDFYWQTMQKTQWQVRAAAAQATKEK